MPSLWGRFKNWVNDRIQDQPSGPMEPPPPPPIPPIPGEDEEPPYGEDPEEGFDVYDEFGDYWGNQTWEQWYNDTLLSKENFQSKYGLASNIDLIYALEETLGIDWDWEQWRADYEAANG